MTDVNGQADGGSSGTRRRGKVLEDAILAATLEQLRTVGYAGLSMEGVAAGAGTGKAALYRRWSNREELVTSALSSALPDPSAIVLSGDARDDFLALLGCVRDAIAVTHGTVFQVVRSEAAEAAGGMMHVVVGQRVMDPCHERIVEVLRAGVGRGRLRPGADSEMVATVGPAMIVHYVVHQGPTVPDDYLGSIVDDILMPLVKA
ncbi:TetR/AcrR family transcriptional regulator C-terminal ligand-binding domain-containing protein [Streptomyces sp. NBC_00247]|uniref:TetR-like C-terminal domain-containing protein n=1 Tax=Streptomyces sp. NBC_00247 TaxID=2975689 RepID=UPI002E29B759|nr:TetR-like C-terminal domain-containing protein [Streptomyces sp. NBC_00247]